jgi:hypothetical protein
MELKLIIVIVEREKNVRDGRRERKRERGAPKKKQICFDKTFPIAVAASQLTD